MSKINDWSIVEGLIFVLGCAVIINVILFFLIKKVFDSFDKAVFTSVTKEFVNTIRYTGVSILIFIFSIFGYTDNQDDSQDENNNK